MRKLNRRWRHYTSAAAAYENAIGDAEAVC